MSTITKERLEQLANFRGAPVTRQEEQELAHIALASREAVPSPELLCQFVMQNYANYQGAWLCGKSSEILSFLLLMAGHECEKVACTINGVGHLYVRCGDLILDPSIAQFGDYPEISRGEHPCTGMGYVENSTEPQKYRNAISDSDIIRAMKIAQASLEAEPVAQVLSSRAGNDTSTIDKALPEGTMLFTAPPAPVVPDERYQHLSEIYHAQEKRLFKLAQRIKGPSFDKYAHSPSQAIDVLELAIFGEREDGACRAAMLQGADGNSPVIQNGWVLVPVEPTTNQWAAGMQAFDSGVDKVTRVYKAMLAAAPQQEAE